VNFEAALDRIRDGLQRPLPGAAAQDLLTPIPRREWPQNWNPARTRNAAGLLLLFPIDQRAHIVLTLRSDAVRHAGQVSMPGGVVEPGETFEQAALREAHEEVGLAHHDVEILGALTPIDIPVSGFRLHPIVAAAAQRPALLPADGEVARILEVDLENLLDQEAVAWRPMMRDNTTRNVPFLPAGGAEIWGATAMVLAEFLTILGWKGRIAGEGGSGGTG
jgi:8-oxo-dGTP pyrophosphatase MutT (NUDIX family)